VKIWVDADACPHVIKEILYRAAARARILTTLVANSPLRTPLSEFIRTVRVAQGSDVADHRIVQQVEPGDLVITADIPLAAEIIARGAHALDPRGELYSEDNVRERLAIRNLMQELRSTGTLVDGPAPFGPRERRRFADHLDRLLTRREMRTIGNVEPPAHMMGPSSAAARE
jgi:uncharacterized protein YaiI (UPF0178 family)